MHRTAKARHGFVGARVTRVCWVSTLSLLAACAAQPKLVPAPGAQRVSPGGTIARDSEANVTITVDPDAWRGDVSIESAVTPMHVQIENNSDHKLRIHYSDFILAAEAGERYVALPPYDIRATVRGAAPAYRYAPVDPLGFTYDGFLVAPYYHYMYPGLSVWDGPANAFDPRYYGNYYPYWGRMRIELPTAEMLRSALPEGVLEEDGKVTGFLYFDRIDPSLAPPEVTLKADIVDVVSDEKVATLEVPFVIREK